MSDPLEAQFSAEFAALYHNRRTIALHIRLVDAWILLSQLQLALRHSENTGPSAERARHIAKQLQAIVAPSGALAIVAERGWDAQHDVPRAEPGP